MRVQIKIKGQWYDYAGQVEDIPEVARYYTVELSREEPVSRYFEHISSSDVKHVRIRLYGNKKWTYLKRGKNGDII